MAFKMKGHTLPGPKQRAFEDSSIINSAPRKYETQNGVKAFKDTTLEDGKAASSAFQMNPAFKHFVDDVPSHQESYPDHSDDLQTDEEHQEAHDRLYWPDGTKRTEREIFEYDETKAEETKEPPPTKIYDNGKRKKNPGEY